MSSRQPAEPVLVRPWVAVAGGAVAGVLLATAVMLGWNLVGSTGRRNPGSAASRPDTLVEVFRLAPGAALDMLVLPAGPDATGEPHLAARLFPDADPPRELASVLVANTGAEGRVPVDLAGEPLRARFEDGGWAELAALPRERIAALDPTLALRVRGLGGTPGPSEVAPGTLRRFLLVLPPGRTLSSASIVQWGERTLERTQMDIEHVHAFREQPVDVTPTR